jgi:VIT1/CCC1 family predicted Fe2+/Mn2+ transporter
MSATSEPTPDRPSDGNGAAEPRRPRRPERRPPRRPRPTRADLDVLTSEPSLDSLRWHGWQLADLPTTSVGWAFAGALGTTLFAYGAIGAGFVVTLILVAMLLAWSAVMTRDLSAARATLRIARVGLLGCLIVSAVHL